MKTLPKKSLWTVFAVYVISGILSFTAMAASDGLSVIVDQKGSLASEVTLRNLLEQPVSLSDFRGQLILMGFASKGGQDISRAIEQYRQRIRSDFTDPEIPFLKVNTIDKPFFITEKTILKKMRKGVNNDTRLAQQTLVNFDLSLGIDKLYGITNPDIPWFFVVGKNGHILFACSGSYSENNVTLLKQELSKILEIGEEAYLNNSDVAYP